MVFRYKRIYLGAGSTIIGLFVLLGLIGLQITSPDGDFSCVGDMRTWQECASEGLEFGRECGPCTSKVKIYNPTIKNIFIYNKDEVDIDFSPEIKDSAFYVKDGRCSGKLTGSSCSCYLNDGTEYAIKGWRCVDFTNRTKPRQDRIYVFRWSAYDTREHLLAGFKEYPEQEIKWTIGTKYDTLDPVWKPAKNLKFDRDRLQMCFNKTTITEEKVPNFIEQTYYETECNTIYKKENCTKSLGLNGTVESCDYVVEKVCEEVKKSRNVQEGYKIIMREQTECVYNGTILLDGKPLPIRENMVCDYKEETSVIECDSTLDGNGDGVCQREGGETCQVFKLLSNGKHLLRESNSEKFEIPVETMRTKSFEKSIKYES